VVCGDRTEKQKEGVRERKRDRRGAEEEQ